MGKSNAVHRSRQDKIRIFIAEYLRCFNATESARLAGYSAKTAYSAGWRLLRNVEVRAEIERQLDELAMPRSEVLARLTQHARGNVTPFITSDGHIDLSTTEAQLQVGLLKKVKVKERTYGKDNPVTEHETEIELHDPQAALVQLGRYHKLFTDRVELATWQTELVDALKQGKLTPEDVIRELGREQGIPLIVAAGQIVPEGASGGPTEANGASTQDA